MFVTSVDVEAGMWGKTRKNMRKAKDEPAVFEESALDVEMANEDVSLDYGDPAPSPEELLWKDAEASFDTKAPAASTDVQVGGVLAWKVCEFLTMYFCLTTNADFIVGTGTKPGNVFSGDYAHTRARCCSRRRWMHCSEARAAWV